MINEKRRKFLKILSFGSVSLFLSTLIFLFLKIFLFPFSTRKTIVSIDEYKINEGINEFDKEKIAIIKNKDKYLILSTVCTHLGCTVKWDNKEHIFECPCHQSVFSHRGVVLKGPAAKNLNTLKFKRKKGKIVIWL
jgi:cytochrome b6-f complex iron-sulfur subunit